MVGGFIMTKSRRKNKAKFTKSELDKLPDSSGMYRIQTEGGRTNYVGVSNNVKERLKQHKREGNIPGSYFSIEYMPKSKAETKENSVIRREKPKHNKRQH